MLNPLYLKAFYNAIDSLHKKYSAHCTVNICEVSQYFGKSYEIIVLFMV